MHGRIVELTDDTCVIETLAGKIKFERSAISMELSIRLKDNKKRSREKRSIMLKNTHKKECILLQK